MIDKALNILKKYWGFDHFRPKQKAIIEQVLDNRDGLALLPTGGGKSLCFQVPALTKEGICIVISPLIALMNDQVSGLRKRGIKADMISSSMSPRQIDIALDNCIYSDTKFLYLSPERINSVLIKTRIKQMKVNLFAIDEAHCISQWGHDFRPAYRNVSILKELHLETPVVALTATATKKVADDICNQLELRNPFIQKESFIRANIIQRVERIENKAVVLEQALHQHPGSVIIYTRSRKRTESISKKINDWGFKASYYHAGLDIKSRKQIEKSWKENKTPIVVATNAFGMGIDKADVRLVVHMDIPGSMEEYYQESGRAGRDGKPSTALIIYNKEDVLFQTKMFSFKFPERKAIKAIYNSLGNYFQIGSGGGQGMAFVFDLNKFCKTFNYEPLSVHYALQILQNEGYIFVSEEVTKSSKLKIIQGRNQIETIIEQDSFQSKVLSVLLRSHTSLFQDYIKISESDLAAKLESDEQKIGNSLQLLEKLKVVDYKRKNFHPRIIYSNERLPSSSLSISKEILEERKESAQRQLDYMVSFVEETEKCRTNIALYYFNERPEKRCGKCDTCEKKSGTKSINSFLLEFISEPKLLQDIINQSPYAKTETIEAIRLLLEDKKLGRTENKITPFTS